MLYLMSVSPCLFSLLCLFLFICSVSTDLFASLLMFFSLLTPFLPIVKVEIQYMAVSVDIYISQIMSVWEALQ